MSENAQSGGAAWKAMLEALARIWRGLLPLLLQHGIHLAAEHCAHQTPSPFFRCAGLQAECLSQVQTSRLLSVSRGCLQICIAQIQKPGSKWMLIILHCSMAQDPLCYHCCSAQAAPLPRGRRLSCQPICSPPCSAPLLLHLMHCTLQQSRLVMTAS